MFDVDGEHWNRGAAELHGDLYLTGFDDSILAGLSKRPLPIDISEHKDKFNAEGGYQLIRQKADVNLPEGTDVFSSKIKAVACYTYETMTDVPVCIDPEPNKRDKSTDACQARNIALSSQAAPVAITSVEVEPTPQRTLFRIKIKNDGTGTVIDQAKVNDCIDPDTIFADTDWVDIESVRLGVNDMLQCEPSNPVKISGGTATLRCIADNLVGNDAYLTVLNVHLSYGYRQDALATVELRSTI